MLQVKIMNMGKVKIVLTAALSAIVLSGCAPFWQILTVTPFGSTGRLSEEAEGYVFREECGVDFFYDFWASGGNAGFLLVNNGDEDVTIDLGKSHFIKNGLSYDYYLARTFVDENSTQHKVAYKEMETAEAVAAGTAAIASLVTTMAGGSPMYYSPEYNYASDKVTRKYSVMTEEKRYVTIPAHSSRYFSEYSISNTVFKKDGLEEYPMGRKEPRLSFAGPDESPVVFENRITLVSGDGTERKVTHKFYVSELVNAGEGKVVKNNYQFESGTEYRNVYESPRRYYNKYEKRGF